jgi:hypothetical protein
MKNLIPLTRKMSYWDDIVNNKNLAARTSLQAIRIDVSNRFTTFTNHTVLNTLGAIAASPFVSPNIALLESCYSKSNGLSKLKTKIKEKQSVLLRSECQYCNIGEPSTFDHYLPQVDFPEFSALSINLFPCCSKCNTEKGEEWLLLGNRKIINYYYDTLPSVSYLNCEIIYRNNTPEASFSLNSSAIPLNLRPIIITHFTTLKLFNRYKQKSNSEITDILNAIVPLAGQLSRVQIQVHLTEVASRMKVDKGENYWRAVLMLALSNSNRFLTYAGY